MYRPDPSIRLLLFYFHCAGLDFCYQQGMIYGNDTGLSQTAPHSLHTSEITHNHNLWLTALQIIGRDLVSVYDNLASSGSSDLYSRTTTSLSV